MHRHRPLVSLFGPGWAKSDAQGVSSGGCAAANVDRHALAILEFEAVRGAVAELCLSPAGAACVAAQPVLTDPADHRGLLRQVSALRTLLAAGGFAADGDLPEVADVVALLSTAGTVMEPTAAARLGRFLRSALTLHRALRRGRDQAAALALVQPLLAPVAGLEGVPAAIFRVVDSAGAVRERELPTLAAIAGRIQRLERQVDQGVRRYLTGGEYRGLLTGDRATERSGRTVIPVKANHRGRIRGIVHETSASGATLFVEPEENVQLGNRMVEERHAYRRELHRIMRELSARVAARQAEIAAAVAAVAAFDAVYARARYAQLHRCAPAESGSGMVDLRAARHPLLGTGAVPIDVRFGGARRVLIVTGPNTGGKTVALKTVGLLALMNQFGMEVPAAPGSVLPLFDLVLADIGDEQSIAQSLSTFSGHVRQLAHIAAHAGDRSLVLLDELGAGTDPEEGVALAMAVLDRLIERHTLVAATTHHGALKNYGYLNAAVENASMEFDPATLRPTYRLVLGIPGESHALEIAARQGLTAEILATAESYLAHGRTEAGEMIRTLTAREWELHARAERHRQAAAELEQRQAAAAARERDLSARERELRAAEMRDLRAFLRESRSRLEGAIRELRESGRSSRESPDLERAAGGAPGQGPVSDGSAAERWRESAAAARAVVAEVAARLAGDAAAPAEAAAETDAEAGAETDAEADALADAPADAGAGGMLRAGAGAAPAGEALARQPGAGPQSGAAAGTGLGPPIGLAPGVRVRIPGSGSGSAGTVVRAGRRGTWVVETGSVRGTFAADELEVIAPPVHGASSPAFGLAGARTQRPLVELAPDSTRPVLELNIRGQRLHEALPLVERQLDAALLAGLHQFSILHGKGEGILRHAIHQYLERHRHVVDYGPAPPHLGGDGKTMVRLA